MVFSPCVVHVEFCFLRLNTNDIEDQVTRGIEFLAKIENFLVKTIKPLLVVLSYASLVLYVLLGK